MPIPTRWPELMIIAREQVARILPCGTPVATVTPAAAEEWGLSPDTLLVVGGAHVSGDPVGTMERFPQADFGFVGEAERGLTGLARLSALQRRDPAFLAEIPGLPRPVFLLLDFNDDGLLSVADVDPSFAHGSSFFFRRIALPYLRLAVASILSMAAAIIASQSSPASGAD